ncbi:MAG: hypothetical protein V3T86_03510 [Planctomycetota bacterium]
MNRAGLLIALSVPGFLHSALWLDVPDRVGLDVPDRVGLVVTLSVMALSFLSLLVATFSCRRSKLWLIPLGVNAAPFAFMGYFVWCLVIIA